MNPGLGYRRLWGSGWLPGGLLALLACGLIYTGLLWRYDHLAYDWNLGHWQRPAAADIVIVAIDEASIQALGRWPWSRRVHARLLQRLGQAGVAAVGVDILFTEPDLADPGADQALAQAIAANGRVLLPALFERTAGGAAREIPPLPELLAAGAGIGHVDTELDGDGLVRSAFLRAGLGSPHWPHFALGLLELSQGSRLQPLPGERRPLSTPAPAQAWIRDHRILIPYLGPPGSFPQLSYADLLRDDFPLALLRGKTLLVGATLPGLGDMLATPVSGLAGTMSGVELNANLLQGLRDGLAVQPLGLSWQLLLSALLALLGPLLYPRLPARWSLPLAALLLLLPLALSGLLLRGYQLWFPPSAAQLALLLSYPLWSGPRLLGILRRLFEETAKADVVLRAIGDAVIATDRQGRVTYMNPVAEQLIGQSWAQARNRPQAELLQLSADDREAPAPDPLGQCLDSGERVRLDAPAGLLDGDGRRHTVRLSAAPIRGQDGKLSGAVLVASDISDIRRLAEQLVYRANHDPLTELPNRQFFVAELDSTLQGEAGRTQGAVMLLDLDRFARLNDALGHEAGDECLLQVSARLDRQLGPDDRLARIGGDEFGVLLPGVRDEHALIQVARRLLAQLELPLHLAGRDIKLGGSIGIALYPRDGAAPDLLLRNAGSALNLAKRQGRGGLCFFATEVQTRVHDRLLLEQELRQALAREQLFLHYQPQLDLSSGAIAGVEALLRWRHPELGLVPPDRFIPLAEETGLILQLGDWILETACRQARDWRQAGLGDLRMSVNLSPRQLSSERLPATLERILADTGMAPQWLDLEITESLFIGDDGHTQVCLQRLRALGFSITIDDFGTGYSSLSYLQKLPVDWLKIDRSFVMELTPEGAQDSLVPVILAMARSLGLKVVAEGVETREQLRFLRSQGCELAQGYYFSKPVGPEQIVELVRRAAQGPWEGL